MDSTSPLTASNSLPLPPMPMRGTRDPAPNSEDFRAMLEMEGVKPPKSAAEAQITAAQIASKANVNAGVKRDPVLSGMQPHTPTPVATTPGKFFDLRQGPGAAKAYSGAPIANTVAALRATSKFAPGSVRDPSLSQSVPAVAESIKRIPLPDEVSEDGNDIAATMTVPKAVEAYSYGLRATTDTKNNKVPAWFDDAVESNLEKLQALKSASK